MDSDSNIANSPDSPNTAIKTVAAFLVCGVLCVLLLPAIPSLEDSASPLDPAGTFQQLTDWQLPTGAKIVANDNTHGGMTNDGDYMLIVQLSPQELQALVSSESSAWDDCPVAPEIARSAWGLPAHNGKQYYAKKTFDTDADWHRGHIVIINQDSGYVWIYEWKS